MKRFLLLFILTTFITFIAFSTFNVNAQLDTYGWQIDSFKSDINIRADGKVAITEILQVDFGTLDKHGIFRDIPYIYTNTDGTKTYTEIEIGSVKRNTKNEKYKLSKSNGYVDIKIGDANKTISGKQTYEITYMASGILLPYESYDELYWNVTGDKWGVPIQNATATVTASSIIQTSCYQGSYGASEKCPVQKNTNLATFTSSRPLLPAEGLTIAVGYTKGTVPILTISRPKTVFEKIVEPQNLLLTFITIAGLWIIVISRWWQQGRDFWFRRKDLFDPNAKEETRPIGAHETLVVEYSPPANLRPAELGTLIDQKADTRDVTATIIDLATRGYLKIEEVPKSWLFGKVDYKLTKKIKDNGDLLDYEKKLYDEFFDNRDSVKISSLKNTFYQELSKVKDSLYENMVAKKLFTKRPDKIRTKYFATAIVLLFMGAFGTIVSLGNNIPTLASATIGLTVGILPLLILANYMPRRTAYGHDLYLKARGYFLFVDKAEKYKQRFFENKNLFNEVLPYAITFGLTEKFAQAMKDIGLKPQTSGWYVGTHAFNVATFGNNIESFSNSVSKSMASTPHSSGSGGGGFSGGGSGGGGGGSW